MHNNRNMIINTSLFSSGPNRSSLHGWLHWGYIHRWRGHWNGALLTTHYSTAHTFHYPYTRYMITSLTVSLVAGGGGGGGGGCTCFLPVLKNLTQQIQYTCMCMGIWDPTSETYKYCDKQNKRETKVQYWQNLCPSSAQIFPELCQNVAHITSMEKLFGGHSGWFQIWC